MPSLTTAGDPPMWHTIGAILLQAAAYVTAASVLGAGFLWLALPRIKEWLRHEIADPVQKTHKSVTVNGGKNSPPTLMDKVGLLTGQVDQLIAATGATAQRASDLADRLDDVHDIAAEARDIARQGRDEMREHEAKGEQYLGKVRLVMKTQGIEIPSHHDDD